MTQIVVRVHLRGGLGNQLFQYGAGFALAKTLNSGLILDSSLLPLANASLKGISSWPVQLEEFNHYGEIERKVSRNPFTYRFHSVMLQADRALGDCIPKTLSKFGRFSNESKANESVFRELKGSRIVLNSYCNSSTYFMSHGEAIRHSISSLRAPSGAFQELARETSATSPLALHIRLGDYTRLGHIYGKFDPEYVRKAISLQFALNGERPIWLFSDDVQMALSLIDDLGLPIEIKEKLHTISPLETMLIMSKCNGLVASNSSFSWWAAYLSQSNSYNAIFPRPFFAPGGPEEPKDWLLPSWIQLGREI